MSNQAAVHHWRGKKWSRLCVLTAAASLPLASEAYNCGSVPSLAAARKSAGPIHLSQSAFCSGPAVCPSSAVGGSCHDEMRMSATACGAAASHALASPIPLRPSSIIPPSCYLSNHGPNRIRALDSPDRYGGRASGTVRDGGNVEDLSMRTLGFVIDDADGIGSTTSTSTRLEMSTSTYDNENEPTTPLGVAGSGAARIDRRGDRIDDQIRAVNAATSSPLKKRVAESLVGGSLAASDPSSLKVPAWFPWLPTREQIGALESSELREACSERGLVKAGNKEELQSRLLKWTKEQHRRRVLDRRIGLSDWKISALRSPLGDMIDQALSPNDGSGVVSSSPSIDESDLFNRRKALKRSKDARQGKGKAQRETTSPNIEREDDEYDEDSNDLPRFTASDENLAALKKVFDSPTAKFSNYEITEMYRAAKYADQNGDRKLAKKILTQLHEATPNDSRVLRRLARMEVEEGNMSQARAILQRGIRRNPTDAYLLQGLAQIELKSGDDDTARGLYKEAIRADPKLPNPYHALGTLEHSRGNIRVATTVLRHGLKMCPTNHRLHHALGDLYREARMLDMAELAYRKALKYSPEWSKSFVYTALAFLAYDKGDQTQCRKWLHEGVEANGGMHSQGWLALAHLEESEGRVEEAREVYREAAAHYERRRIQKSFVTGSRIEASSQSLIPGHPSDSDDSTVQGSGAKTTVKPSLSGDKWIFLYRSWARMEEQYGTYESANRVYQRASKVFPGNSVLLLDWAQLNVRRGRHVRARSLFGAACDRAGDGRADPHRLFAEFEMSLRNFSRARSILYRGAQSLSESHDGGMGRSEGLAHLYHTWAVCEWHLGNLDRTEVLFDHALRLTDAGQNGSEIRSLVLYSIARFLYDARGEFILAQHCVCLSLKENFLPGGNSQIWLLWAEIAKAMGNDQLVQHCTKQAKALSEEEAVSSAADLSRLLGLRKVSSDDEEESSLPMISGPAMQKMLRKEPWHHKIVGTSNRKSSWYDGVPFPEFSDIHAMQAMKSVK